MSTSYVGRTGWVTFAAIIMFAVGFARIMIFGLAPWYAAAAIGLGTLVVFGLATSPSGSAA